MDNLNKIHFSESVSHFHGRPGPESHGSLAGYGALITFYDLKVPLPERLGFISTHHRKYSTENWLVFTPRHKPEDNLSSHLTFALKYEGVDLLILSQLFKTIQTIQLEEWMKAEPNGSYSRRIWFFYEWLTGKKLNIADSQPVNYVDAIDTKLQFGGTGVFSRRHHVRDNMPGLTHFCPLVRRTEKLEKFITKDLRTLAKSETKTVHPDVLARAAAFLLLKDTRASFAIEGETPPQRRADRWGRAVAQAGQYSLNLKSLETLQRIIIEDNRFVNLGLRKEGVFIGVHDRVTNMPIPDHIAARWEDLPQLLNGLLETYKKEHRSKEIDPVIFAAIISFGFVFIHPFEDGNGRIHRYLIHHVLSDMNFSPQGLIFPVSAVMLEQIDKYRQVLESYSKPRLEFIDWQNTKEGNIEVINDTIDYYKYFDATLMAEFLYECVEETIQKLLPEEIVYLQKYDLMKQKITEIFDMPNYLIDLLIRFLEQNNGKLSKRAREKEFKGLTKKEYKALEELYEKTRLK